MSLEKQLELFTFGGCNSCQNVGYFNYNGTQKTTQPKEYLLLYNCPTCKTTKSYTAIKKDIQY